MVVILKQLFPHARFSAPAASEAIVAAESALGVCLPDPLRGFYLECDGFREDKGNAKYLLSLIEDDFVGSVVKITRFLWTEVASPNLKPFVFFGSSSEDKLWGINVQRPTQIIAFHHSVGDQYEEVGSSIPEVWQTDYTLYDKVS